MNLPCDHQPSLYADSSKLPKALPDNGRIAIIAPAGPAQLDTLTAIKWFEARGYLCRIYPGVTEAEGYLAGSDARRLADLHAAFAATDVDAIICLRGGYGSMRLLEGLDYALLRSNPKPLVGYSDITALHNAIARHAGFVTFHGAMLKSELLANKQEPSVSSLFEQLSGRLKSGDSFQHPARYPLSTIVSGAASGRLMGGNLAMLCATLCTSAELNCRDGILFIEDVNEPLYRIDRLLTQLRLAGRFDGLRGVLVGDFAGLKVEALRPLLQATFEPLQIPVLAGWRSGHCDPNLTLPLGAQVHLDADQHCLRLQQDLFAQ
ncbi:MULTISPECIES: LD-carboxypeptidase [Pseudomonas]|uniref:LD-carboxypeptidase n=1 Tax=Pseudomonas sp. Hg7Tf TaxID=3236988 RepID=A0AB39I2Q1_9PSED|nr:MULTISPECIES: LD-carboxypeptidase [Pseudomonas]MDD1977842.1 LD-carboxypeptidase [Pseudomonas putida]MDH2561161.1 LD-carboxypeptidase [Pseudomonas sp. Hg5Tf]QYX47011.1 LD-carboxypeptidase [Pseudomonas sp. S11A 273]